MRRLCLGGSFNPVHNGHLICARRVAEVLDFERVVLIPSGRPPHKPGAMDLASGAERLGMLRAAVDGDKLFEINDLELNRAGLSYTIDTARELGKAWGQRVSWLIGADLVAQLPSWHEPAALAAEVDFVVMARPGFTFDWDRLPAMFSHLRRAVVEAPAMDISATEIRRRVGARESIENLTPPAVIQYIADHHLYPPRAP